MPMTSRIGASAMSPNDSVHSSTPFASISRSATRTSLSRFVDDLSELGEELAELLHSLLAESGRPLLLQAGDDCEGGADLRPAAFRQADERGATVRRVGAPFEVA